jgi:hypothetical protein
MILENKEFPRDRADITGKEMLSLDIDNVQTIQ